MRILFLDQFNQPGGAQQCLLDLLPAVQERGWQAHVMLPGEGPLGDRIRNLGIEVLPVRCGRDILRFVSGLLSAATAITKVCADRRIDLIYVNGPRLVPAASLAAANGRRVLFHCHSYLSPRYLEWITALPLRYAQANVAASSHFVAQPLRRWIPSSRIQIVYNGVRAACRKRLPGNTSRIGIIGRIAPEKGQEMFLRAARLVHRKLPVCEFVVCGAPLFSDSSYEREIRPLAQDLPVDFTGWTDDVDRVLANLDLLVVPSTQIDATPRIILQAFAAKVPVVGFANVGFRELIEDGKTGFLLVDRTPEALAAKIQELLAGDRGRIEEAVEAAWQSWGTRFSLETYRSRMIEVLEEMA